MQERLKEVKESNVTILVSVEKLHVLERLQFDIKVCEVELLAAEQYVLQLVFIDLSCVWTVLVAAKVVEKLLDVH